MTTWTAAGVVVALAALVVAVLAAELVRLRRENESVRRQNTDYLVRLVEAEHARREAEQTALNLKTVEELRQAKGHR